MIKYCFWGLLMCISSLSFAQNIQESKHAALKFPAQNMDTKKRLIFFARQFLNKPYVANTLETKGEEELVLNFDGFDCSTLVETCLALAISKNHDFEDFKEKLTQIRYRNGLINGYGTRLHYLTEWLIVNEKKGLFKLQPTYDRGTLMNKVVDFMSTNPQKYPRANTTTTKKQIKDAEKVINATQIYYWPKNELLQENIADGDIVAITTSKKGLDCSHQGIAIKKDGHTYLLHASFEQKKVIIAEEKLENYLKRIKSHTGIILAKLN